MSAIALGTHARHHSPKNSNMRRVQSVGSDILIPAKNSRHSSPPRGQAGRNSLSRRGRNPQNESNDKILSSSLRGLNQSAQGSKDFQSEIYQLQKQLNTLESSR